MQNGRVVHFEDDPTWQGIVANEIERSNHEIVATAGSLPDALGTLDAIHSGELEADVVVTDGNLDPDRVDYADARAVAARISELGLPVRVIGFSGGDLRDHGVGVDDSVLKARMERGDLARIIDGFPEPETTS